MFTWVRGRQAASTVISVPTLRASLSGTFLPSRNTSPPPPHTPSAPSLSPKSKGKRRITTGSLLQSCVESPNCNASRWRRPWWLKPSSVESAPVDKATDGVGHVVWNEVTVAPSWYQSVTGTSPSRHPPTAWGPFCFHELSAASSFGFCVCVCVCLSVFNLSCIGCPDWFCFHCHWDVISWSPTV